MCNALSFRRDSFLLYAIIYFQSGGVTAGKYGYKKGKNRLAKVVAILCQYDNIFRPEREEIKRSCRTLPSLLAPRIIKYLERSRCVVEIRENFRRFSIGSVRLATSKELCVCVYGAVQ